MFNSITSSIGIVDEGPSETEADISPESDNFLFVGWLLDVPVTG